ncbi:MAG: Slp family lipoprotein [Rudaea sp.]
MRHIPAIAALAVLMLAGCATVPPQLAGDQFSTMTPQQAVASASHGERVRWGGELLKVEPKSDSTCFEVMSRPLWSDARPKRRGESSGRFIACSKGFYDPELYRKGRDLTVVGQVDGSEQHKVGEYNYTYAHVAADHVHLWPVRDDRDQYGPWPRYYDPFWGPYDPFWGGGLWWSRPPIIIVHSPSPPPPKK